MSDALNIDVPANIERQYRAYLRQWTDFTRPELERANHRVEVVKGDQKFAPVKELLSVIDSLSARVKELELKQRTPGTVEVCERWPSTHCAGNPNSDFDHTFCRTDGCPIKAAAAVMDSSK